MGLIGLEDWLDLLGKRARKHTSRARAQKVRHARRSRSSQYTLSASLSSSPYCRNGTSRLLKLVFDCLVNREIVRK